jgi:hypothetical protein
LPLLTAELDQIDSRQDETNRRHSGTIRRILIINHVLKTEVVFLKITCVEDNSQVSPQNIFQIQGEAITALASTFQMPLHSRGSCSTNKIKLVPDERLDIASTVSLMNNRWILRSMNLLDELGVVSRAFVVSAETPDIN